MELRLLLRASIVGIFLLSGCRSSIQLPSAAEDITLCKSPDDIVSIVRDLSIKQGLDFKHIMYEIDFGTQTTFRLMGDGFEIVLYNAFEQGNYTLRLYQKRQGHKYRDNSLRVYNQFRKNLAAQAACETKQLP